MNKLLQGKDYSNYFALNFSRDLVTVRFSNIRIAFCVGSYGKVTSSAVGEISISCGKKTFVIS